MKAHSPTHQHNKKSIFEFLPGPVKIKDGLFLGDQIAARDIQFIMSNKVTHIINTVSKQIPNLWQRFGIHYLSVNWTEKQQNIFDKKNTAVNMIHQFVQQAMKQVNGKSRACAVLVAYLIKKYSWSLNKCLEFISSKKQNLEIRDGYLLQMQQLQHRMKQIHNLTSEWQESKNQEQLVLRNTLINSKQLHFGKPEQVIQKKYKKKVSWGERPTIIQKSLQKTMLNLKQSMKATHQPMKSILRGDPFPSQRNLLQSDDKGDFAQFEQIKNRNEGNYINNINGNIVHVTVNNFITPDKKSQNQVKNPANTRPFSSDQKDREKQKKIANPKKILAYDTTNGLVSFKSPYDTKLTAIRAGNQFKALKKEQKQKQSKNINVPLPYERPQSAKSRSTGFSNRLKDDFIVTNSIGNAFNINKKRLPINQREDLFRKG